MSLGQMNCPNCNSIWFRPNGATAAKVRGWACEHYCLKCKKFFNVLIFINDGTKPPDKGVLNYHKKDGDKR